MRKDGVLNARCIQETGNVPIAEKKSRSFHLNLLQIDQFIAEIAGEREEPKDPAANDPLTGSELY